MKLPSNVAMLDLTTGRNSVEPTLLLGFERLREFITWHANHGGGVAGSMLGHVQRLEESIQRQAETRGASGDTPLFSCILTFTLEDHHRGVIEKKFRQFSIDAEGHVTNSGPVRKNLYSYFTQLHDDPEICLSSDRLIHIS